MTAAIPAASRQAVVEAALVLLEQMGLAPTDLAAVPQPRKQVPTLAEYVPVVSAAVSAGIRQAYGSYWNRVLDQWGTRRLDEPTPSEQHRMTGTYRTSTDVLARTAQHPDLAWHVRMAVRARVRESAAWRVRMPDGTEKAVPGLGQEVL